MSIIGTVIFGAVAGGLGKLVMPGNDPGGWIITPLLGIGGAVLMNFLAGMVGMSTEGSMIKELIAAIIGVVILLFGYRQYLKMRGGGTPPSA
jgi:uncharacterized membrane protein YeaQ/YmgE (transglycosylase-associated protein family)